jgi:hypothetical protein
MIWLWVGTMLVLCSLFAAGLAYDRWENTRPHDFDEGE